MSWYCEKCGQEYSTLEGAELCCKNKELEANHNVRKQI